MDLRVLGAHNLESVNTKHTCFLLDGVLAIDAGSLVSSLTTGELERIKAILLTHRHYDHIRDLPTLGLTTWDTGTTVEVYALQDTLAALSTHLMDGVLYPDLTQRPLKEKPKYRFQEVTPGRVVDVLGYEVKPIGVPHGPPAVGYIVRRPGSGCFAYSGDTSGGLLPFLQDPARPDVLFVEVTFPSRWEERARQSGHLTPGLLQRELETALEKGVSIPPVVAVHIGLKHELEIKRELEQVAAQVGVNVTLGKENMAFRI